MSKILGKSKKIDEFGRLRWVEDGKIKSIPINRANYKQLYNSEIYDDLLRRYENKHKLPRGILKAVMLQEGADKGLTSSAGAAGLFHIMPKTEKALAEKFGLKDRSRWDIEDSAEMAATLLSDSLKRYKGSIKRALIDYNAGSKGVEKYDESKEDPRSLPPQTAQYVFGGMPKEGRSYTSDWYKKHISTRGSDTFDFEIEKPLRKIVDQKFSQKKKVPYSKRLDEKPSVPLRGPSSVKMTIPESELKDEPIYTDFKYVDSGKPDAKSMVPIAPSEGQKLEMPEDKIDRQPQALSDFDDYSDPEQVDVQDPAMSIPEDMTADETMVAQENLINEASDKQQSVPSSGFTMSPKLIKTDAINPDFREAEQNQDYYKVTGNIQPRQFSLLKTKQAIPKGGFTRDNTMRQEVIYNPKEPQGEVPYYLRPELPPEMQAPQSIDQAVNYATDFGLGHLNKGPYMMEPTPQELQDQAIQQKRIVAPKPYSKMQKIDPTQLELQRKSQESTLELNRMGQTSISPLYDLKEKSGGAMLPSIQMTPVVAPSASEDKAIAETHGSPNALLQTEESISPKSEMLDPYSRAIMDANKTLQSKLSQVNLDPEADFASRRKAVDEQISKQIEGFNDDLESYKKLLLEKPYNVWADRSAGNILGVTLAAALGAVGQTLARSDKNLALEAINMSVEREIEFQKNQIQKYGLMSQLRNNMLGVLFDKTKDMELSQNMLRRMKLDAAELEIKKYEATADTQSKLAAIGATKDQLAIRKRALELQILKQINENSKKQGLMDRLTEMGAGPGTVLRAMKGDLSGIADTMLPGGGFAKTKSDADKIKDAEINMEKINKLVGDILKKVEENPTMIKIPFTKERAIVQGMVAELGIANKEMSNLGVVSAMDLYNFIDKTIKDPTRYTENKDAALAQLANYKKLMQLNVEKIKEQRMENYKGKKDLGKPRE